MNDFANLKTERWVRDKLSRTSHAFTDPNVVAKELAHSFYSMGFGSFPNYELENKISSYARHSQLFITADLWVLSCVLIQRLHQDQLTKKTFLNIRDLKSSERDFLYERGVLKSNLGPSQLTEFYNSIQDQVTKALIWVRENFWNEFNSIVELETLSLNEIDVLIKSSLALEIRPSSIQGWQFKAYDIIVVWIVMSLIHSKTLNLKCQFLQKPILQQAAEDSSIQRKFLIQCNLLDAAGNQSDIGKYLSRRAPHVLGTIYSYRDYLSVSLKASGKPAAISRQKNVLASQSGSKNVFKKAIENLRRYESDYNKKYNVIVEHAAGSCEAIHQHLLTNTDHLCQYLGFDIDPSALLLARARIESGELPDSLELYDGVDIRETDYMFRKIREICKREIHCVIIVGNGFHEIREKDPRILIEIFSRFRKENVLLIFNEVSKFDSETILESLWNSWRSSFQYLHRISGQNLRPGKPTSRNLSEVSWEEIIRQSGYNWLKNYSTFGRPIGPFATNKFSTDPGNVTYFCVP